jgi:phospholipid/cholesterol/gamma-HCH transport system permease protein
MASAPSQAALPLAIPARVGQRVVEGVRAAGSLALLSAQLARELVRPPFHGRLLLEQLLQLGARSILLVTVTGLATGAVMALQFGYGLKRFGGTLFVPKIVALSILREMGPVFTSLLVCGRIGSGIASEVASMKVTQQIDAVRALGTSPVQRIVIPRVLASLIALPLLTLIADYVGLLAALGVCALYLNINAEFFITKAVETLRLYDLFTGMFKTVVFAFFISVIACWKGLNTEGGTQGVGATTTWVVVTASIFIMVADVFLTQFFIMTVYPRY